MGLFRCPVEFLGTNVKSIYSEKYRYLLELMRKAREEAGVTQVNLSNHLDKPQSFVSKYENGERRLDVIEFLAICKQLKADPHILIDKIGADL